MKTLYIECEMGAAGDMLTAALLDLVTDKEEMIEKMNSIGLDGVHMHVHEVQRCGISGLHVDVHIHGEIEGEHMHEHHHEHGHHDHSHEHTHDETHAHTHEHGHEHHHEHHTLSDVHRIIYKLNVSENVKEHATAIYKLIAQAEAKAHNMPITNIHFHEVGTMDAIADIVNVCMLIEAIAPDRIVCSPVCTGSGTVKCAHGILPVPAPATAYLLEEIPSYAGNIRTELCTPTGAAILKHYVSEFGSRPVMKTKKTGYGMGTKEFEQANCVRVFLGEEEGSCDEIYELCCNIDDMTGEELGFAMNCLFDAGARDVFMTPLTMKKSRPGVLLSVICDRTKKEEMVRMIMKHTTTLGIREYRCSRYVMKREVEEEETVVGVITRKRASGYGTIKEKYEYEDLAKFAKEKGISLFELKKRLK